MRHTARERATLLGHLAGACTIDARDLVRLRRLAEGGLLSLAPAGLRPRRSSLTPHGRLRAERLLQDALP